MLTYITLGLVILKYVLDYVAPKTSNKVDDGARDVMNKLPLPSLTDAAKAAAAKAEKPKPAEPAPAPAPMGFTARD